MAQSNVSCYWDTGQLSIKETYKNVQKEGN